MFAIFILRASRQVVTYLKGSSFQTVELLYTFFNSIKLTGRNIPQVLKYVCILWIRGQVNHFGLVLVQIEKEDPANKCLSNESEKGDLNGSVTSIITRPHVRSYVG